MVHGGAILLCILGLAPAIPIQSFCMICFLLLVAKYLQQLCSMATVTLNNYYPKMYHNNIISRKVLYQYCSFSVCHKFTQTWSPNCNVCGRGHNGGTLNKSHRAPYPRWRSTVSVLSRQILASSTKPDSSPAARQTLPPSVRCRYQCGFQHTRGEESSTGHRWYAINQLRSRTMVGHCIYATRDAQLLSGVTFVWL